MNNDLAQRARTIRRHIIEMAYRAQSAHTGGALSCVELLVSLYFKILRVYPKDPYHPKRDRLVFSKAHDAKALYAVLCERGYFDKKVLLGYEQNDGLLPGHSTRHCVPGVEVSAGSLGHGLSMATGMALAGKIDKKSFRVFALLSDGECDEGSVWEAALFANHHKLDNLTVIVDYNKLQGFGSTKDVLDLEPFKEKWNSFGWHTQEIDGHDFDEIIRTLRAIPFTRNKPSCIIAATIKGLGGPKVHIGRVSSQYKPPTDEEYAELMKELKSKT